MRPALLLVLAACTGADKPAAPGAEDTAADADDTAGGDDTAGPAWGTGPRAVSGRAYFFDMPDPPGIVQITEVAGAEVFVWEAPELRAALSDAEEHTFRIEGLPDGVPFTLGVEAPGYFPTLTGVLPAEGEVEGVTFQVMSTTIATLAAGLLGADVDDPATCHMATTVTAPDPDNVWAPGEPDATVRLEPGVPAEAGPWYFNTSVIPDRSLSATTTDGGVIVVGAEPGPYTWAGDKEGVDFLPLQVRCEAGWLTNASPPFGLNQR